MNYEEMSDFEINKLVAIELRPFLAEYTINHCSDCVEAIFTNNDDFRCFAYTRDVSYIWPIIVDNEMKIDPRRSSPKLDWMVSRDDQIYAVDKNPLRAACICFLKMKDAEK